MKLYQLHYFCTACLFKNITRAAEALHVSQPSVSLAIQGLESEFGMPLLDREARGFALTADGEYLYREGETLLKRSTSLTEMMAERKRLGRAVMRFGSTPMAGAGVTRNLYRSLGDESGSLSVHLVEGGRSRLLNMIDENLLDFALMPVNCLSPEKYSVLELSSKEVVLCVHVSSPLAKLKRLESIEQLAEIPLALFDDKFFFTSQILDYFKRYDQTPRIVCYAAQIYTVLDFVESGVAVAFLCKGLSGIRPQIVEIPIAEPLSLKTGFVWKKNSPKAPQLKRKIARLAAKLRSEAKT